MDINQEEWEARLGSDLSRVCRLCLKTCEAFHPIFNSDDPKNKQALSQKIMACAQVKVFEGDGLPTHICNSCFTQVEHFYLFKILCEKSDHKLRGSIVNMNGSSDSEDVDDSDDMDVTQLMPENPTKPKGPETNSDVFSKIMQRVLGQADNEQIVKPQNSQKKEPVYLKGLPGFVHSNQEMARVAVAMALHQRSVQEQQKLKELEKQSAAHLQMKEQYAMYHRRSEESSSSSSKSRRCRNGLKAFKCTQCNKSYSFSSALSRHKAVHNRKLRPHFCNICNKGFTQKDKLQRHQRTHAVDSTPCLKNSKPQCPSRAKYLYRSLKNPESTDSDYQLVDPLNVSNEIISGNMKPMVPNSIDLPVMPAERIEISIKPIMYMDSDVDEEDDDDSEEQYAEKNKQIVKNSVEIKNEPADPDEVQIKEEPPEFIENPNMIINLPQIPIKKEIKEEEKVCYPPPSGKGKPEFRCSICLKCFATRGSLEVHSNIHTGVRPFVCKICQQAFRHKVNLMEHFQRKHSQVRPYNCDICASRFVTKQELLRHYRKHIGD